MEKKQMRVRIFIEPSLSKPYPVKVWFFRFDHIKKYMHVSFSYKKLYNEFTN